ncbi:hypothetical protein BDR04DRAFT_32914 [Suillus decipiens]|nr:hypothetical protein BDR04DRAFT_32914 [Suillus decipiens]
MPAICVPKPSVHRAACPPPYRTRLAHYPRCPCPSYAIVWSPSSFFAKPSFHQAHLTSMQKSYMGFLGTFPVLPVKSKNGSVTCLWRMLSLSLLRRVMTWLKRSEDLLVPERPLYTSPPDVDPSIGLEVLNVTPGTCTRSRCLLGYSRRLR